jgi:hypothetical protein
VKGFSVTSSCLCKYGEGAGFPFQIQPLEDGVDDSIHTFYVHKAHHGLSSAPRFHEAALDDVQGTFRGINDDSLRAAPDLFHDCL